MSEALMSTACWLGLKHGHAAAFKRYARDRDRACLKLWK